MLRTYVQTKKKKELLIYILEDILIVTHNTYLFTQQTIDFYISRFDKREDTMCICYSDNRVQNKEQKNNAYQVIDIWGIRRVFVIQIIKFKTKNKKQCLSNNRYMCVS